MCCVVVALMDCEMFLYRTHRIQPFLHSPPLNSLRTTLPHKSLLCTHIKVCAWSVMALMVACSQTCRQPRYITCMWRSRVHAHRKSQRWLEAHNYIKFWKGMERANRLGAVWLQFCRGVTEKVFIHWQNWKVAELVNLGEVITFSPKKMRLYTFSNFAGKRMFEILQATFRVAYPIYLMRCF